MNDLLNPNISRMLDHSLLMPSLTEAQLLEGCAIGLACDVASVIVLPFFVPRAVELLAGSSVIPSTTVGFPHGAHATAIKAVEARLAIDQGAKELDMVVNISEVRSHHWSYVEDDIKAINDVTRSGNARLKVIFENAYLSDEEKIKLCEICGALQVDWIKTSTGYAPTGATEADVVLMRKHCPAHVQIKASGGVRTLDAVLRMRELGCTRVGTSASQAILEEMRRRLASP